MTVSLRPLVVLAAFLAACSSAKKKDVPELSELEGRRIALVQVDGEETARKIIEVALINQLVDRGTFILVSKQDVEKARAAHDQDPNDLLGIAQRAGAEYALTAKVLQFDADTHEGYSTEEVEDSQLAEERGDDGKTTRVYKAKSLAAKVRVELKFTNLADKDTRNGIASAEETVFAEAKTSAAHLPPKLRFLEKLSNKAFKDFFDRYN